MPMRSARRSSPGSSGGKSDYRSCGGGKPVNRHFAVIFAALAAAFPTHAQQPVKIGLIMPYSGQFADAATQMDNAIKLYMKEHGDAVAGRKLEIIRRDTGGVAPDIAKRHAQELVVRDRIDILAGFVLTPNALAAADVSARISILSRTTSSCAWRLAM